MASANISIIVETEWVDEPGDGSECVECGDRCWLSQKRLLLKVFGSVIGEYVVCAACADEGMFDA